MSMLALLAPRLWFRLRHGVWCDHQDHYWSSQFLLSGPTSGIDRGFDDGMLVDMGRAKLYTCQRCGYRETNLGHPVRDWLASRPRNQWGALCFAVIAVLSLVLALGYQPDWLVFAYLPSVIFLAVIGSRLIWAKR